MRTVSRILLTLPLGLAGTLASGLAHGQVDINPPLPNVLLLIDTSGSMENLANGKRPEDDGGTCVPAIPNQAAKRNRWATLVEALTGTIQGFSCYAQDRSSAAFKDEYTFPPSTGAAPYDYQYYLPFHRLLSNGCTAGPGNILPTTAPTYYGWPAGSINYHPYNNPLGTCTTPWAQADDGILDVYKDRARFGLMTFDTLPDPGTGATGALLPNGTTGMAGMWSYYLDWQGSGTAQTGQLPACTAVTFEVGARNPAAPPWEGRLIPFGEFDAPLATVTQNNAHLQEALVAMRPYGATPLAGMLADAATFLTQDASTDPSTGQPFGPKADPYILDSKGCRKTVIIVLSDGEPNMDMRAGCDSINKCPYKRTWEIAHDLNSLPLNHEIPTYTIGFGLSAESGTDCKLLTQADLTAPGGLCETATGALKACCELGRVAFEGGTTNARYADDAASLQNVMNEILSKVTGTSTSRTFPVFASGTANSTSSGNTNAPASSYQFNSSFEAPPGSLWKGILERKRYECKMISSVLTPVLNNVDPTLGDDFGANLNTAGDGERHFLTLIHDDLTIPPDTDPADPAKDDVKTTNLSQFSMRPNLATDDTLGLFTGTVKNLVTATTLGTAISLKPQAMAMVPLPVACTKPNLGPSATSGACAERVIKWELGATNADGLPTRDGNEFGSIYHSTPTLVGTPKDFLRDESYSQFALQQVERPLMLYTGTTDGQLHGFKVASNKAAETGLKVDSKVNNELWAFLPPYVLPKVLAQYDHSQQFLLDGPPVIKDIVFSRNADAARAGGDLANGGARWNTVLVGGGGKGGGYYYALDVTDPEAPVFLWQLSTDNWGRPLFGKTSGTPAIATVTLVESNVKTEVAVAILPGGFSNGPTAGTCSRNSSSFTYIDSAYPPRSNVRCWNKNAARSLTIVRLSDGEVLMSFRGDVKDGPSSLESARVHSGVFDSPISGVPVPYPSQAGQVANRIYVGDSDGTLWRIDLSDPTPANWSAKIAWDAYSVTGDTASMGQPIQTPPIVSVDTLGNSVVLFSTGDQETFTSSTAVSTRVWSFREKPTFNAFTMKANWFIPFDLGKRVTGPISLFNSVAYFATFTPASGGAVACDDGHGSIWGVDYIQATTTGGGPRPKPRLPTTTPGVVIDEQAQNDGIVVFGVAVTQTPSCSETDTFVDPYLGAHTSVNSVLPGKFQLVWQTGKAGSATPNSKTNTQTMDLPRPRETTTIASWASIIE